MLRCAFRLPIAVASFVWLLVCLLSLFSLLIFQSLSVLFVAVAVVELLFFLFVFFNSRLGVHQNRCCVSVLLLSFYLFFFLLVRVCEFVMPLYFQAQRHINKAIYQKKNAYKRLYSIRMDAHTHSKSTVNASISFLAIQ